MTTHTHTHICNS